MLLRAPVVPPPRLHPQYSWLWYHHHQDQLNAKTGCLTKGQPAGIPNPNSLATVMKEMRDSALANGTVEPTIDEIEAKYQQCLALHFASGLQLPPFWIAVTSPVVTQAMNSGMGQQQVESVGHLSGGTTNVTSSHSGSLSSTGFVAHGNCSQSVPHQSASSCQTGQFEAQAAMLNMQTDINLE